MRKIRESDLLGKTIAKVNVECVNVVKLTFADGSYLELWAEQAASTLGGEIPGIFVSENGEVS